MKNTYASYPEIIRHKKIKYNTKRRVINNCLISTTVNQKHYMGILKKNNQITVGLKPVYLAQLRKIAEYYCCWFNRSDFPDLF